MVFQNILIFLVSTAFSLYIGAVVLRFLLAWARADFYNPLAQFIVKITNPPLIKLRKVIPAVGKVDTAAVVLALLLKLLMIITIGLIKGNMGNIFEIVIMAIADLARTVVWIYIIALIIQAVISWTGSVYNNPMADLIDSLTKPILRPIQRYIKPIASIDVSPMVAIILLNVVLILLSTFPTP